MLLNLKTEIARRKTSQAKIAYALEIAPKTLSLKINEKSELTRTEMYTIHAQFFPETDMKYLFESYTGGEKGV